MTETQTHFMATNEPPPKSKTPKGSLSAFIDLPEYISARTNLTKRLVRDAINARYVRVGKEIANEHRWPAEKVKTGEVTIEFPKVVLKPKGA